MARRTVLLARAASLALLCGLAACGGGTPSWQQARLYRHNAGNYRAPGPPGDPWGPYIDEAAARFSIPDQWIRQVMRQESGGKQYLNGGLTTSGAGAMGLMQIMPATYETLRGQYDLGDDPYDPHDNIIAGAGYIRQMYDRFGTPGFLAAYNAGPQRLQDYIDGRNNLPNETVNYVASIAPRLGGDRPTGGPLAVYATAAPRAPLRYASAIPPRPACPQDPDRAYDAPCAPSPEFTSPVSAPPSFAAPAASPPVVIPPPVQTASADCVRDPDAAFDAPCGSKPTALPEPPPASTPLTMAASGCERDADAAFDTPCARPSTSQAAPPMLASAAPMPKPSYADATRAPGRGGGLFNTAHAETLPPSWRASPERPAASALPVPPEEPRRQIELAALPEPPLAPVASVFRPAPLAPPNPSAPLAPGNPSAPLAPGNPSVFRPTPLPPPMPQLAHRTGYAATPAPAALPFAAATPTRPAWRQPTLAASAGQWGIQVGAFADRALARNQAEAARNALGRAAGYTATAPTTPFGGAILYRARLLGLSQSAAADACGKLVRARQNCMVVPPGG